jgi:uncharacterized membrane protein YagU involved in acid resistance
MTNEEERYGMSDPYETHPTRIPLSWKAGLVPGLVGGAVMALALIVLAVARHEHPLTSFNLIAATFFDKQTVAGPLGAVVGLVVHFIVSACLGALFARVTGRLIMRNTLGLGLLYGVFIWAAVQFVFLPFMNPQFATQMGVVWPFFLGHLAYGLMTAACLPAFNDIDAPRLPDGTIEGTKNDVQNVGDAVSRELEEAAVGRSPQYPERQPPVL